MTNTGTEFAAPVRAAGPAYPREGYAWYMIITLMVAYALSFLDRTIINLLVAPIKADLHLSDTQMGVLIGPAFVLLFIFSGILFGRIVDLSRRVGLLSSGLAFWTVATAGCGLVRSYLGFFLCRVGVGVGEATLSPAAYSLVADSFPPRKRGVALGVYATGIYMGQGLALVIGATVIPFALAIGNLRLPLFGTIHSWQIVILLVAMLGVPVAIWCSTLREPERQEALRHPAGGSEGRIVRLSLREVVRYHLANWRSQIYINLCHGLLATAMFATNSWGPTFFIRTYKMSAVQVGHSYGLILTVAGALGVIAGGALGDWANRHTPTGRVLVQAWCGMIVLPFAIAFPLVSNAGLSFLLLAPHTFFIAFCVATHTPAIMEIVPNQMRGFTTAFALMVSNVFGIGLGPLSLAMFTDYVLKDEALIRYSVAIVPSVALVLASIFGWMAAKPFRESLAYQKEWSREHLAGLQ